MKQDRKIRVRFAPSPTGQVHVGNARTALFNWLFARQKGGTYVLRIEDTDVERSEARYETQLLNDLKWLGLDWDEGPDIGGPFAPYRQSERLQIYREHAERLLAEGKAYLCFCLAEELEKERERALAAHQKPPRSCLCRNADPAAMLKRRAGEAAAIRLKIPEHPIRFHDIVRGSVEFSHEDVPDMIIVRSTGMPVYNYVVVIDDALMQITHVIRGDDHLSNTPKQVALYEALGWPVPEFAHLSTILGEDRTRLSKRHGAVSIATFRDSGVLPEALVNYLALLGWAPSGGDREIFSKDELVKAFELERVTPSPAVFDMQKLYWLNRHYISERVSRFSQHYIAQRVSSLTASELQNISDLAAQNVSELRDWDEVMPASAGLIAVAWKSLERDGLLPSLPAHTQILLWFGRILQMLHHYLNKLTDLPRHTRFIFNYDAKQTFADPKNKEVLAEPESENVLNAFTAHILGDGAPAAGELTPEQFKSIMNQVKSETGVKGKKLFHPVRVAVTGSDTGPEFDKLIPVLEEGSRLNLPKHVLSVRERVAEFQAVRTGSNPG
ncbi:MAG: glutamate--tRNA ligase [Terriglobales bacterium]